MTCKYYLNFLAKLFARNWSHYGDG